MCITLITKKLTNALCLILPSLHVQAHLVFYRHTNAHAEKKPIELDNILNETQIERFAIANLLNRLNNCKFSQIFASLNL